MGNRRIGGFVPAAFTEILIVVAISGVGVAIFVPRFLDTRRNAATHECAARLDALAPEDTSGTCPVSGMRYASTAEEPAKRCCPIPGKHELEALCRVPSDAPLAIAHPSPSRARWIASGALAGVPTLLLALFGILMIGMTIASELEKRRKPPASP